MTVKTIRADHDDVLLVVVSVEDRAPGSIGFEVYCHDKKTGDFSQTVTSNPLPVSDTLRELWTSVPSDLWIGGEDWAPAMRLCGFLIGTLWFQHQIDTNPILIIQNWKTAETITEFIPQNVTVKIDDFTFLSTHDIALLCRDPKPCIRIISTDQKLSFILNFPRTRRELCYHQLRCRSAPGRTGFPCGLLLIEVPITIDEHPYEMSFMIALSTSALMALLVSARVDAGRTERDSGLIVIDYPRWAKIATFFQTDSPERWCVEASGNRLCFSELEVNIRRRNDPDPYIVVLEFLPGLKGRRSRVAVIDKEREFGESSYHDQPRDRIVPEAYFSRLQLLTLLVNGVYTFLPYNCQRFPLFTDFYRISSLLMDDNRIYIFNYAEVPNPNILEEDDVPPSGRLVTRTVYRTLGF
ncbi:hypothetical protein SISSUDRAFT_402402 [Sistotremastrum suecicum HHB10207 ss-3]|uniref:Uncharacterized protein n=1 Tax=Sistotremastrum suecicum HHB10207 ss-3 TaxID=1314776 RepID=A0A166FSR9_9AGAM|nr:hypothetical protein SISSUDRAFT_402402 [Sistotremastrum suecicum HHB10207 ss-3]